MYSTDEMGSRFRLVTALGGGPPVAKSEYSLADQEVQERYDSSTRAFAFVYVYPQVVDTSWKLPS